MIISGGSHISFSLISQGSLSSLLGKTSIPYLEAQPDLLGGSDCDLGVGPRPGEVSGRFRPFDPGAVFAPDVGGHLRYGVRGHFSSSSNVFILFSNPLILYNNPKIARTKHANWKLIVHQTSIRFSFPSVRSVSILVTHSACGYKN